MKKVVTTLHEWERAKHQEFAARSWPFRLLRWSHLSSAGFDSAKKADLDVRGLQCGRRRLPVTVTLLFALATLLTFAAHVWSSVANYERLGQASLAWSLALLIGSR